MAKKKDKKRTINLEDYGLRRVVVRATEREWGQWKRFALKNNMPLCDILHHAIAVFVQKYKGGAV